MSSSLVLPILLASAWASGNLPTKGLVNPLGTITSGVLSSSASLSPGASLADGYPIITTTNPLAGGVAPAGADLNGILNYITSFQAWVNAGGAFSFNSTLAAAIGGYPLGATLQLNSGLGEVVSTVNGNTQDPNVSMTGWAPYGGAFTVGQILVGSGTGTVSSVGLTYTATAGLGVTTTSVATSGNIIGVSSALTLTPASASSAAAIGAQFLATTSGGISPSVTQYGLIGGVTNSCTAGTLPLACGVNAYAVQSGAGTTTQMNGLLVNITKNAGVVSTACGIYINPVTAGSVGNYAIYTGAGIVNIGDTTASTLATNGALVVAGGVGCGHLTTSGNINVAGTGGHTVNFANFSSNGSTATALGSVGPAGSSTVVGGWINISVNGTVHYVPYW